MAGEINDMRIFWLSNVYANTMAAAAENIGSNNDVPKENAMACVYM
jgi:hypothetical protein